MQKAKADFLEINEMADLEHILVVPFSFFFLWALVMGIMK